METRLIFTYLLLLRLVFVYGSADPDDFRKLTANIRKKCLAETKISVELVQNTEYGEFPEDDALKCYFKCAFERAAMMGKDGTIKYDALKKIVPGPYKEMGNEMIESCSHIDAQDKCVKAFNFMKCMYETNPVAFIAP